MLMQAESPMPMLRRPSAFASWACGNSSSNSLGRISASMPRPSSSTQKRTRSSRVREMLSSIAVASLAWMTTFSIRLPSTCSMSIASIGTISSSSGTHTRTGIV